MLFNSGSSSRRRAEIPQHIRAKLAVGSTGLSTKKHHPQQHQRRHHRSRQTEESFEKKRGIYRTYSKEQDAFGFDRSDGKQPELRQVVRTLERRF